MMRTEQQYHELGELRQQAMELDREGAVLQLELEHYHRIDRWGVAITGVSAVGALALNQFDSAPLTQILFAVSAGAFLCKTYATGQVFSLSSKRHGLAEQTQPVFDAAELSYSEWLVKDLLTYNVKVPEQTVATPEKAA